MTQKYYLEETDIGHVISDKYYMFVLSKDNVNNKISPLFMKGIKPKRAFRKNWICLIYIMIYNQQYTCRKHRPDKNLNDNFTK